MVSHDTSDTHLGEGILEFFIVIQDPDVNLNDKGDDME
jgi:hypothetical protein